MEIIRRPRQMQAWADAQRAAGRRIGLVPTMGALHEGHVSLLRVARESGCEAVTASVFVNPTQFGPEEDFVRYPRDEGRDLVVLEAAGADAVYLPGVPDMYPEGYQTSVEVEEVSQGLCGASRPGHFRGVTTVVAKLFHAAKPHVAVFGEKDYQQLAVIRRMVRDLDWDIEIVAGRIVREDDGLAMSSRNRYLDGEDRTAARCLSQGLSAARALFQDGERDPARVAAAARAVVEAETRAALEYAEAREPATLAVLNGPADRMAILLAARVGPARLIDAMVLERGQTE